MANEAQIRTSLQIDKGTDPVQIAYRSQPTVFLADVAGVKGPLPGAFAVSTAGTDVDFSELTTPALCRIMNLDATNFVTYGIWDPEGGLFFPLGEMLPGESYILRLSRVLQGEFGTEGGPAGTVGPNTNRLRCMADTAAVNVLVEAFEV